MSKSDLQRESAIRGYSNQTVQFLLEHIGELNQGIEFGDTLDGAILALLGERNNDYKDCLISDGAQLKVEAPTKSSRL